MIRVSYRRSIFYVVPVTPCSLTFSNSSIIFISFRFEASSILILTISQNNNFCIHQTFYVLDKTICYIFPDYFVFRLTILFSRRNRSIVFHASVPKTAAFFQRLFSTTAFSHRFANAIPWLNVSIRPRCIRDILRDIRNVLTQGSTRNSAPLFPHRPVHESRVQFWTDLGPMLPDAG